MELACREEDAAPAQVLFASPGGQSDMARGAPPEWATVVPIPNATEGGAVSFGWDRRAISKGQAPWPQRGNRKAACHERDEA